MSMTLKTYVEVLVEVEFEYDPGEPMVRYYANGDGHPGVEPSVEIMRVLASGIDIYEALGRDEIEALENACMESMIEEDISED